MTNQLQKPNLFQFATKELSQDAFIAWLLEWSREENEKKDDNLHKAGKSFADALFEKAGIEGDYKITEVKVQKDNIDVLVYFEQVDKNNNIKKALIIEDKTDSDIHDSNIKKSKKEKEVKAKNKKNNNDKESQLSKYRKIVEAKGFKENDIFGIVTKTGNFLNNKDFKGMLDKEKYTLFDRVDFLNSLESNVNKDMWIIDEFFNYWTYVNKKTDEYKECNDLKNWSKWTWQGFFNDICVNDKQNKWYFLYDGWKKDNALKIKGFDISNRMFLYYSVLGYDKEETSKKNKIDIRVKYEKFRSSKVRLDMINKIKCELEKVEGFKKSREKLKISKTAQTTKIGDVLLTSKKNDFLISKETLIKKINEIDEVIMQIAKKIMEV